jgi:hypothetical protein
MHRTRLIVGLAVLVAVTAGLMLPAFAQEKKAEFVGNAQCKMCHNKKTEGEQWNKWHGTKHATALATLKKPETKAVAEKAGVKGDPSAAPECVRCHVTGYDVEKKALPAKLKDVDGVQCEACHGPASLHLADAKIPAKMTKKEPIDATLIVTKPEEKVCTKCHNQESPTFKSFDFKEMSKKIAHPNPLKAKKTTQADDKASPAAKDQKG